MIGHSRLSGDEISRRGREIYYSRLRSLVEVSDNIGKMIHIDIETGDYEIGDYMDVAAGLRLHAKHEGAALYGHRIGYKTAVSLGGMMERETR